ncbi:hypothetical protein D3C73_1604840 [compost metagenome]
MIVIFFPATAVTFSLNVSVRSASTATFVAFLAGENAVTVGAVVSVAATVVKLHVALSAIPA